MSTSARKTKNTTHISVRIRNELVEKIPETNKSKYVNTAIEFYQTHAKTLENWNTEKQALVNLVSEYKTGCVYFFQLFQKNAGNIELTEADNLYLKELLQKVKSQ
ncbi:hypothetical protein [Candidatus Harpocratesius sp.]